MHTKIYSLLAYGKIGTATPHLEPDNSQFTNAI